MRRCLKVACPTLCPKIHRFGLQIGLHNVFLQSLIVLKFGTTTLKFLYRSRCCIFFLLYVVTIQEHKKLCVTVAICSYIHVSIVIKLYFVTIRLVLLKLILIGLCPFLWASLAHVFLLRGWKPFAATNFIDILDQFNWKLKNIVHW